MSSKDRYGKFRKKHFTFFLEETVAYLGRYFGYKILPRVRETKLMENALMIFKHTEKGYAIEYDYGQFKETFGKYDFETQKYYVVAITAHEMRHYYQHRQMDTKAPKESADTIALWRKNEKNPVWLEDGYSLSEYCLQPLEVDAVLFEYTFAAKMFDVLLLKLIRDEEHLAALEKLYIAYHGKTDRDLFGKRVRKLLRQRRK